MFVFIIDTAMLATDHISSLDISKHAIEAFLTSNSRIESSIPLQIMLMQTGHTDDCLLSSFCDPPSLLEQGLKNLKSRGADDEEPAELDYSYPISYALSIVNTYRMKSGVDTFGHGRAPW
jgi:hypothetical protein